MNQIQTDFYGALRTLRLRFRHNILDERGKRLLHLLPLENQHKLEQPEFFSGLSKDVNSKQVPGLVLLQKMEL